MRCSTLVLVMAIAACGGLSTPSPEPRNISEPAPTGGGSTTPEATGGKCNANDDCPKDERCDACAASSCPECDDCIPGCVPR